MFGQRILARSLGAVIVGGAISATMCSPVLAADPKGSAPPVVETGDTGVVGRPMPAGFDQGITPAQRQAKELGLRSFEASAKANSSKGVTPTWLSTTQDSVHWRDGIHQQTTYYCVNAVVQTMAYRDIGAWYLTMGTGSVKGAQDKIYAEIKDPYVPGSNDWKALAWINRQYANAGQGFRYMSGKPENDGQFGLLMQYDIAANHRGVYVRVDLSSGYYVWRQARTIDANGNLRIPEHATMGIAYDNEALTQTTYDPFTSRMSDGSCSRTYRSGYTWACGSKLGRPNYFRAMDRAYSSDPYWW